MDDERTRELVDRALAQDTVSDLGGATRERLSGPRATFRAGERVDRYVIVDHLGSGGMGVVYAAYDPELDRRIALKLLRGEHYPTARDSQRLLREAQALARLAHPNVVTVFDAGTDRGQVWLAMELVSGQTLRTWLCKQTRSWPEIVDVLADAGEGIAAAHAQGLVHRDVKPDNVIVGDDGRVRVMDFGLARAVLAEASTAPTRSRAPLVEATLTAGGVAGTPAYMPPELLFGFDADAASDQFSFCVTLWEALYAERPFAGGSSTELYAAISEGRRRPPPAGAQVPAWLRRHCERGLASEPSERWPSMRDLLDALARGRLRTRRRRAGLALAVVACVAAATWSWRAVAIEGRRAGCVEAGAISATLWSSEAKAEVSEAIRGTGVANAEATIERLIPRLDAYTAEWSAQREQACLNAEVERTWEPGLSVRAVDCLEEQLENIAGILAALRRPDNTTVNRALPAVASLRPPAQCLDPQVLTQRRAAGRSGAREAVWAELWRLNGRRAAGDYARALAEARRLRERIDTLGDPALRSRVQALVGDLVRLGGSGPSEAADAYIEAYIGAGALQDDGLAATNAIALATLLSVDLDRVAEATQWAHSAEMLVRRQGEERGRLGADLASTRAQIALLEGRHDEAEALYREALAAKRASYGPEHPETTWPLTGLATVHDARGELRRAEELQREVVALRERALGPEHPSVAAGLLNLSLTLTKLEAFADAEALLRRATEIWAATSGPSSLDVATARNKLAGLHSAQGHYDQAIAEFERVLEIRESVLGAEHRQVAETLNSLAILDRRRGDYERAEARYRRAKAIWEASLGVDHPNVASVGNNLAELYRKQGRLDEARALHEEVLARRERRLGSRHPHVADSLSNLGLIARAEGDLRRAESLSLRALEIRVGALGEEHSQVAVSLNNLGDIDLDLGELDRAEERYRRALEIMERRLGPEHLHLSYPLHGLGLAALRRGAGEAALPLLRRALGLREAASAGPGDRAEVRFALARALWRTRARRPARAAAETALTEHQAAGQRDKAGEVEAWLAAHR